MSSDTGSLIDDLEDLYENAPCGYLSVAADGSVLRTNTTFSDWLGFVKAEIVGKKFNEFLTVSGRIFYETHFVPLLRIQGFFDEVAFDFLTKDGKRLPVLANAKERRDDQGRLISVRVVILRATQRRQYERDLVEQRRAAISARRLAEAGLSEEQAVAELREQFIAVLGHDLRNPLASIGGGARMLLQEELSPRAQKNSVFDARQRSAHVCAY